MHWANDWVGTPYADRGRGPDAFDCWGQVRAVLANRAGIQVPSYDDEYAASVAGDQIQAVIDRECAAWLIVDRPPADQPYHPGLAVELDVVILRLFGRRMHCGVMLDDRRMLHTLYGSQATVETLTDDVWRYRVDAIYRHKALA